MKLITEDRYKEGMQEAAAAIESIRRSGTFERNPGEPIYYELYTVEESKGCFVISHGFTESTVKYTEVIYYLTEAGYSVAIVDHRGHGRSYRDVEDLWLTNVDNFDHYRDDFIWFIHTVVMRAYEGQDLFVLGHSMGGAIAAHVAEYDPELPVKKYILSSPMIAPATGGVPEQLTKMIDEACIHGGKGHEMVFVHKPFDPAGDWGSDGCCATSEARYTWYLEFQREHPEFQNAAATYNWLRESLRQTKVVLNPASAARVQVPVLLIQAGKDTMVKNEAQDELLKLLPNGKKVVFPAAKHEIFRCTDYEVKLYINTLLNFVKE